MGPLGTVKTAGWELGATFPSALKLTERIRVAAGTCSQSAGMISRVVAQPENTTSKGNKRKGC